MVFKELVMAARKSVGFPLVAVIIIVSHFQGMVDGKFESLYNPGDSVIGSIVPTCVWTATSYCGDFHIDGLLQVEAIIYAVENVNKRAQEIGMNSTLGYDIRDPREGVYKALLSMIVTTEKPRKKPFAIIGSLDGQRIGDSLLLLLSQPMVHISCNSQSMVKSDFIEKSETIFHVYPSDRTSIKAMVNFVAKNQWSYVGAVTDEKAHSMMSILKDESSNNNVCVGATYTLPYNASEQHITNFVRKLKAEKNYSVIVVLTNHALTRKILKEASKQRVNGLTWIAGQRAWSNTRPIPQPNSASQGMFSVLSRKSTEGFADHLRSLSSGTKKIKNIWLRQMASKFSPSPTANILTPNNNLDSSSNVTDLPATVVAPTTSSCDYDADPMCDMDKTKLRAAVDKMIAIVEDATCIIDAVYTVAQALAEKERCVKSRDCKLDVNKFQNFVQGLDVTNPLTGSRLSFSPRGYLNYTLYHVFNYQQNYSRITTDLNKDLKAVDVGTWAYSPQLEPKLKISEDRIEWHGGHTKRQESRCHEVCMPGKYRALKKNRIGAECCWQCQRCPKNTYSDTKDASSCKECQENQRVSLSQAKCVPYYEDYVHWEHAGSLFVLFLMVVGLCFSLYVSFVLFHSADTPIVKKAKNAVLCLLPFTVLLFLLPIPLLGKPTESSCEAYRIFFVIGLGIPLAVLLAKSQFFDNKCKDQSENNNTMCTPRFSIVCFIVLCHVFVALILAIVIPAKVNRWPTDFHHTVFLECSYHSSYEFLVVVFYIMFIAVLVAIFSINEVLSEENFYEVKWISMAIFNWYAITFFYVVFLFGVHYHAKIIMLALMDLLYAANIFGMMYIPKWFVIVFKPEKNRSDVSPWTDYIKTQERVSERLSAPEDSPIISKKGKTTENADSAPEEKVLMADTDI